MKIIFLNRPIGFTGTGWFEGTVINSARSGYKRIQLPDGNVLSIQPSNTNFLYEERPLTSDGGYEQFVVGNDKLAVNPDVWAVIPFMQVPD